MVQAYVGRIDSTSARIEPSARDALIRSPKDGKALSSAPGVDDIKKALDQGQRRQAVQLWLEKNESRGQPRTKARLFRAAKQHKSEYYRWEKGKLPDGSAADKAIRRALTTDD